jgi:LPXTG-motif cell wall-anchored protein
VRIRVIGITTTAVTAAILCIAVLLSTSPASAGGYGGGSFTIDDPTLGPDQQFHLVGTGCLPGSTVVIDVDGRRIGTPTADGNGNFELEATMPEGTAPGHHTVTATCGDLVQALDVTVAANGSASPPPRGMPRTGTEIGLLLRTAAALVLVGIGLVVLARRRRATVRPT